MSILLSFVGSSIYFCKILSTEVCVWGAQLHCDVRAETKPFFHTGMVKTLYFVVKVGSLHEAPV